METSQVTARDPQMYPKLRENIWHIDMGDETAMLITTRASFEVDRADAFKFFGMRSYCTGCNSIDEIAKKSGLPVADVVSVLDSLREAEVIIPVGATEEPVSAVDVRAVFQKICELWSDELRNGYIGNELAEETFPKTVLIGWLVEMYHYVRDFPYAIERGAANATGKLKDVLVQYANQEKGHEGFITQTLNNLGVSTEEVETSTPLVSTRLIGFLMREMFEIEPASALMMAALVEAQDFDPDQVRGFVETMQERYDVTPTTFDPFFSHQRIDFELGHAELLSSNADLITVTDRARLDSIVNKLHDLKHAFELQTLEIKSYYGKLDGKYFPRQPMGYASL